MTAGIASQIYNLSNNFPSPRIQAFGDSRASYCGLNVNLASSTFTNPAIRYPGNSPLAWANRFLRGRLNLDLSLGYQGQFQAVSSIKVVNGGSNYTAPTISFTGVGTGLTFGTPVLSGGVIQSVPITAQGINFTSLPTINVTDSTGSGAQLQAILGGTGTFGVAGETSTQCVNRLNDIVAASVDIVFVCIGTNDLTNSISASTTKANLQTIFDTLIQAGKFVIYCPDQARSYWGALSAGAITNARRQMYNVKRWVYQYASIVNSKNTNGNRKIIICDLEDFWSDAASSTGNPLSQMTSDGLHWSQASAQCAGLRLARQLQPILGLDSLSPPMNIISQADTYDATYNPDGTLNFNWLMNGTSTSPTAPLTGIIAGNLSSGSATGTMAGSIETTRTDGLSGNRQVFTFSLGGGTNSEQFSFGITSSAISSYNINVGDSIIVECDMWLSSHTNVNQLLLQINFTTSGSVVMQGSDGDTTKSILPASSAYMALSGDSTSMTFITPAVTVPSGVTNFTCYAIIGFDASGAAGSATATWKITNFKIRKVI
ncbi:MAG: SGNH/GDSL hydrolase family protein [Pseudomonadota bacterium]